MKSVDEMSSSELFTAMTEQQKDDIYRMVWFGHVAEDATHYIKDMYSEDEIPEEDIESISEDVANAYVCNGKYDCNCSYWDNIDALVERFRGDY